MSSTLIDADWTKRKHPISFAQMISVKDMGHDVFESVSSGYPPTAASRTYGGHVYAQAAYAASKTVAKGMCIHNCTGYFLLLGDSSASFRYHIKRVRDGGVYCLRTVEVFQDSKAAGGGKTPCFVATVAFKRDEGSKHVLGAKGQRRDFEHQDAPQDHVNTVYRSVLDGKDFEDHPVCPAGDGIWSNEMSVESWKQRGEAFPGLEMRKVNMRRYHQLIGAGGVDCGGGKTQPERWRLLMFYRLLRLQDVCDDPKTQKQDGIEDEDDLNLHACAHLYASDRNSLFLAQRALGHESVVGQLGSLAHTIIFHGPISSAKMVDDRGRRKIYVQESWTSNSAADRVCHNSRLWDYAEGRVIMTTLQDGMMRIPVDAKHRAYDGDNLKEEKQSKL
jgi:acyl-CoA thioesterase